MAKIGDAGFKGVSGATYRFDVYTLDTKFNNIGALYIYSTRTVDSEGRGKHKVLYIGEARELKDRIAYHEMWPCFERYSVNCICIHPDKDEDSRLRKQADLLRAIETPCNEEHQESGFSLP
jgi:hypothetical protein